MEKYFVTYNQSLALKELGFDEPCLTYYHENKILENEIVFIRGSMFWNLPDIVEIAAPLKQQVFRWFREKHNLYHTIHHFEHKKDTPEEFLSEVSGKLLMGNDDISGFSYHSTYNDAESACIDKLIEIVKNK